MAMSPLSAGKRQRLRGNNAFAELGRKLLRLRQAQPSRPWRCSPAAKGVYAVG